MAITIEVTRGRYLRHLREHHRWTVREATERMNALLPSNEQVTHAWLFQVEKDNPKMKMSALKALALHKILGADLVQMGVSFDDFAALRMLTEDVSDLPAARVNKARARPRRSSSCIAGRDIVPPNVPLVCASSNAEARVWGGRRAHRT